jgi:hypothetical protein
MPHAKCNRSNGVGLRLSRRALLLAALWSGSSGCGAGARGEVGYAAPAGTPVPRANVAASATFQTQLAEVASCGGAPRDLFGYKVAVSGDTAVVSTPYHKVGASARQGAAYVFVRSGAIWVQQAELTASDGAEGDSFGYSVAMSDGMVVVGAPNHRVGANENQGAAYVFVRKGATWTQQPVLTVTDGRAGEFFGVSVALSGSTVLIGTNGSDVSANEAQGAAYVFVQSGTSWTRQAKLTVSDGATYDFFGWSVALDGGTALIGAPRATPGTNAHEGAAYVFVQSGTAWTRQARLTARDGAVDEGFGWDVALSGTTAIIGLFQHKVDAAYIFAQSGASWPEQAVLVVRDGEINYPGNSVAISAGTAIVGVGGRRISSSFSQGAAHVFVQSGAAWPEQAVLTASDGAGSYWDGSPGGYFPGDNLGYSVAINKGIAVVGAINHQIGANYAQGAAYLFVVPSAPR